jgi:hypothetical protein
MNGVFCPLDSGYPGGLRYSIRIGKRSRALRRKSVRKFDCLLLRDCGSIYHRSSFSLLESDLSFPARGEVILSVHNLDKRKITGGEGAKNGLWFLLSLKPSAGERRYVEWRGSCLKFVHTTLVLRKDHPHRFFMLHWNDIQLLGLSSHPARCLFHGPSLLASCK